jgi:hypothetical protein
MAFFGLPESQGELLMEFVRDSQLSFPPNMGRSAQCDWRSPSCDPQIDTTFEF